MAKGAPARLSVWELIAEGSDFARDAWRDCWAPMVLVIIGHTVLFLDQHASPSEWRPGPLGWLLVLLLAFYIPLFGALYRVALGGRSLRTRGVGGLQFRGEEWRLVAIGVVLLAFVGLIAVPFFAMTGVAALIMGVHAVVTAGPLGQWARWMPAALVIWLVFLWLAAPRAARLALGWPYSIARGRTQPLAGWGPGHGHGWSIFLALLFAVVPILLGQLGVYALTLIAPDVLASDYWPLPWAIGAGVLLGVLKAAVAAPIAVGVLAGAYWLLDGDTETGAAEPIEPHHDALPDDAALAAAAALSAHEAAELGLPPSEVDHSVIEAPLDEPGEPLGETHETAPVDAELHAPDAAPVEIHPDAAIGAEAAALAQAYEAHAHEAEPDPVQPEPEAVHAPEPEVEPPSHGDFEALSTWPHSVLPPWPTRTAAPGVATTAVQPLASDREPAQP